jgi:hypothetical protein
MKIRPWMYGAGVIGVAGIGVILYEVTKKPSTAIVPPTGATGPTSVTPSRPTAPGNTFAPGNNVAGTVLTVVPGTMGAPLAAGDAVTLVLPAGGTWSAVIVGNSMTHAYVNQATLGSDLTSPVSLTLSQLQGGDFIQAAWDNRSGHQETFIQIQNKVKLRP